jgi:hypothetical protein
MNKTKSTLFALAGLLAISILLFSFTEKETNSDIKMQAIESGFRNVPDSIRIGCYWYWISDNISKEGVVRDLEAMKKAGITRAFIGNIGQDNTEYGPVKILSPEWWEITHTAMKKAGELGIEIGMFNSPGWSQSGGPWVKSSESMRFLAFADTTVKGGQSLKIRLRDLGDDAQDVKVIAYPALPAADSRTWKIEKKDKEALTIDMSFDKPTTVRSLIYKPETSFSTKVEILVREGNEYRPLKGSRQTFDRSNTNTNVGFSHYAPIIISLPETTATDFRLLMDESGKGRASVTLSSQPMVERYAEKTLAKMWPTPSPMWDAYLWDEQPEATATLCISPEKILDLSASMKDGLLEWDAPQGSWTVSRIVMKPTGVSNTPASPEGRGLEIDKLSKKHAETHFNAFIGEILRRIPAEDRKTFKVVVEDSYETGGQNWTDDMIARFKSAYGYDPVPYLPTLEGFVVESRDKSDRFLWDLRRLIADGVSYEYVGGLREISNRHGLTTWLENYGHWGFPGEFLQYGGQSDEIGGEFWGEGDLGDIENKAASSSAHIYGKTKVWAESCTSGGPAFSRYPAIMKGRIDRFFAEGINSTLLHVYIHQPFEDREPGLDAWFGNEFNRKNTWFSHFDIFTAYLRRCNLMLQQGLYVADVAYFIGEDAPKMTGIRNPELPKGYSYDYINAEVLLTRASVKNGKLTLPDGMQYSLLVLPPQSTMRPATLRKISELVNEGLNILGPAPTHSPSLAGYPQSDNEVKAIAASLWGTGSEKVRTVGKGKVFAAGQSIEDAFAGRIIPDFSAPKDILYIHRTTPEGDIYFITNQSKETVQFRPEFRLTGKAPEWWNPAANEIRPLPEYTLNEKTTAVPLELQPLESGFVVFRKDASKSSVKQANFPEKETLLTVSTPWTVKFQEGKRGPEESVTFNTLQDLSTSDDARIRYFSGSATYSTTFTLNSLPKGKTAYIDLGKVMIIAKVKLNGKPLGGVWTAPYRVNVNGLLNKGKNTLEVEVINNWQNRLIGDLKLPEQERKTWVNINPWKADSPLQSSGLLGPVTVQAFAY